MKKIAFVYPGQGVQAIGMGKDFFDQFEEAREQIKLASKESGIDLEKILFEENDLINQTEYTQLSIVATCAAMTKVVEKYGIKASYSAGLSLGEYAALIANKALAPEDAYKLIYQRGKFMQNSCPGVEGGMSAIIGLGREDVQEVCDGIEGACVANLNCPGQIVISGEKSAVTKAGEVLKEEKGAKRVVPLNVSGAFHSTLMCEAAEKLEKVMEDVTIHDMEFPYVANVNAKITSDKNEVKDNLIKQVYSPVRWEDSARAMIADGVDLFIEIGPGKTIAGFMKKIDPEATVINIATVEDLEKLKEIG